MRFREFIGEEFVKKEEEVEYVVEEANTGQSVAFFISPRGELINTGAKTHIDMIIKYPDKFGLTQRFIEDKYEEFDEKMGIEGTARSQIILLLIKQGWIRIRRYPKKFWTINVDKLDNKVKDRIYDWSQKMLDGTGGYTEQDKNMKVVIHQLQRGKKPIEYSILKLSNDALFNESIGNRSRYIVVVKDIKDTKRMDILI